MFMELETDIEFSEDIYTLPKNLDQNDYQATDVTLEPAIEIVLTETPRDKGRKAKMFFCLRILSHIYR